MTGRIPTNFKHKDHKKGLGNRNDERMVFRHAVEKGEAGLPLGGSQIGKVVHHKLDFQKSKKVLQPNSKLCHYAPTFRIRGYYGSKRCSHGCDLSQGADVACRVVLEWLWQQHKRHFPKSTIAWEFPYELTA